MYVHARTHARTPLIFITMFNIALRSAEMGTGWTGWAQYTVSEWGGYSCSICGMILRVS